MRTLLSAMLVLSMQVLSLSSAYAQIAPTTAMQLCQAAEEESALVGLADDLLEQGVLALDAGEALLSLSCGEETLLARIIRNRQAENLEFVVIDMGMDLDRNQVDLGQGKQSLRTAMTRLAARGDAQVRAFVVDYLKAFSDEEINPNLQVSRYP